MATRAGTGGVPAERVRLVKPVAPPGPQSHGNADANRDDDNQCDRKPDEKAPHRIS
jgi:hypothetical protein